MGGFGLTRYTHVDISEYFTDPAAVMSYVPALARIGKGAAMNFSWRGLRAIGSEIKTPKALRWGCFGKIELEGTHLMVWQIWYFCDIFTMTKHKRLCVYACPCYHIFTPLWGIGLSGYAYVAKSWKLDAQSIVKIISKIAIIPNISFLYTVDLITSQKWK